MKVSLCLCPWKRLMLYTSKYEYLNFIQKCNITREKDFHNAMKKKKLVHLKENKISKIESLEFE